MEHAHVLAECPARVGGGDVVHVRDPLALISDAPEAGLEIVALLCRYAAEQIGGARIPMRLERLERIGKAGIAALNDRTRVLQGLRRTLDELCDFGIDLHVTERDAERDAQTRHTSFDPRREVPLHIGKRGPIAMIRA